MTEWLDKDQKEKLKYKLNDVYTYPLESFYFDFTDNNILSCFDMYRNATKPVIEFYVSKYTCYELTCEDSYNVFVAEMRDEIEKFLKGIWKEMLKND